MGTAAARGRAARPLAVLALLLGLLAMHGLASTDHAAAATPAHHAAPVADAAAGAAHHQHVPGGEATAAAQQQPAALALAAPAGPACDDGCPDLEVLCVAMLGGAALALLLARSRRTSLVHLEPVPHRSRAPAPPVRHARGPDPVEELCVSRT